MAPIPKRLNLVSFAGPDPTIEISAEQFAHLELTYGRTLSSEDRAEITMCCRRYLVLRRYELISGSYAEVRKLFDKVKEAVRPFLRFTGGHILDNSDASAVLRGILHRQYRRSPVYIHSNHLSVVQKGGLRKPARLPGSIVVELMDITLTDFAESLNYALQKAEQEIQQQEQSDEKGFAPGRAFREWLVSMRLWAKERGYPTAPFKNANKSGAFDEPDRTASPFAGFLFALNQLFRSVSPKFAEPVNSPEAMAERLKKVARVRQKLSISGEEG